jgi:hypothetical protein
MIGDAHLPNVIALAAFRPERFAVIGVDGIPTISIKGRGFNLALVASGWHVLTRAAAVTFELGFDELRPQIECLRILQRLAQSNASVPARQVPPNLSERLFQTLVALDGSLLGLSYREIAATVFGERRVAEDWGASSRFLKDRTRRLVVKGHELMNGGYRDLLR